MEMQPVESSNVAKVGWERGVVQVIFRDGKLYAGQCSEEVFNELLAAPSKGRFIRERLKLYAAGGPVAADTASVVGERAEPAPAAGIDTHEADGCCAEPLSKALLRGDLAGRELWFCPRCGSEWNATVAGAGVRHWQPAGSAFQILKLRELRGRRF